MNLTGDDIPISRIHLNVDYDKDICLAVVST